MNDERKMKIQVMQGPCDSASFEDRFKKISETAVALCSKYNDHYPEIVAFTSDGQMMSIGTEFQTQYDSPCFASFCRGFFDENKVVEYFFISTAWNLDHPSAEERASYKPGAIRANPRSKETLCVIGKSYFESKLVCYEIKRDEAEKINSLTFCGEGTLDENSTYGNLLPEIKHA